MRLRPLEIKDAPLMLEWMHDDSVVHYLDKDFSKLTIEDCKSFIETAQSEWNKDKEKQHFIHLAVVNENDEYLGTVSLKDMDREDGISEFGISMRTCAMGHGISIEAMRRLIAIGFTDYGLNQVYWYVNSQNKRALRFYEKNGFVEIKDTDPRLVEHIKHTQGREYIWFLVDKNDAKY